MSDHSGTPTSDSEDLSKPAGAVVDVADALVALGGVRRSLDALSETTGRLVSKDYIATWQTDEERKRRNFATLVVAVGICFFILFGFLGYGIYVVSNLVQEVQDNSQTTVNCTDPSIAAPCYKARLQQSQRQRDQQTQDIIKGLFADIIKYYEGGGFNNGVKPPQ